MVWLVAIVGAALAVSCATPSRANAAQAFVSLTLNGVEGDPGFVVTAEVEAGRRGGPIPACDRGDVRLMLDGPTPILGTTTLTRIAMPLDGASLKVSARYAYTSTPRWVTLHGLAQCQGLPPQSPVEKSLSIQIPAAKPAEPPKPESESPPPGSMTNSVREHIEAGAYASAGGGGIGCGMALAADLVSWGTLTPIAVPLCIGGVTATAGAGVALAVDPPDPNFRTLQPADFSPARFEPKRQEFIRCRLLSRRTRSRLSCRDVNEMLREWLRDTNEFAWLSMALGVSANRWNTARASAAQLSSEELNRILSLHHAAARVYVGQATKVMERRASTGRLLRTYIRGTALDLKFSRRFRAKALARFSRLEGVPRSTQLDLARAGFDVPGAVGWVTKRMRSQDLPSSLSALLAAAPTGIADSSDLRFSGLSRGQQVSLLQAWLGERAHGLSGECGYSLTTAITNIVRDLPESYAGTLAEHVNQSSDATGRCIFAPNLPEAREGYVKGPRQLLVKSALDITGGLETAQDIHVSPRGELLAVDETAHLIRRFTLDGSPIGTFGSGTLEQPVQATTDSTGAVFVSDWTRHEVQRFSAGGVLETAWGGLGSGPGQFDRPAGIAVTRQGHVVVADANNRRLQVFDRNGVFLRAIVPPPGPAPGFLSMPRGIAVAPDGTIAVADLQEARVVLFSADGAFVGQTSPGIGLEQPYDVQYDPDGVLWVADRAGSRSLRLPTLAASDRVVAALGPEPAIALAPTALAFTESSMLTLDFASQQVFATPRAPDAPDPPRPPLPPPLPPVPPPSGPSPRNDVTAPKLTHLKVVPRRLRVATSATTESAAVAKKGTRGSKLTFKLSEEATVTFDISRLTSGRRVGKACKKRARSNQRRARCTRRIAVGTLEGRFRQGAKSAAFTSRIAGRNQRSGRYEVIATPTDIAGNNGHRRTAFFKVAARR